MKVWLSVVLVLLLSNTAGGEVTFQTRHIRLGNHVLKVEIADNDARQKQGLKERTSLGKNEGMLFVFPNSGTQVFWMNQTFIPLSIGIFDTYRKLIAVEKLTPARSVMQIQFATFTTPEQTRYALEVPQGWFEKNQIRLGATFEFLTE
jgi:uncharacterized membrane protein (UPF0127 family)